MGKIIHLHQVVRMMLSCRQVPVSVQSLQEALQCLPFNDKIVDERAILALKTSKDGSAITPDYIGIEIRKES